MSEESDVTIHCSLTKLTIKVNAYKKYLHFSYCRILFASISDCHFVCYEKQAIKSTGRVISYMVFTFCLFSTCTASFPTYRWQGYSTVKHGYGIVCTMWPDKCQCRTVNTCICQWNHYSASSCLDKHKSFPAGAKIPCILQVKVHHRVHKSPTHHIGDWIWCK